MLKARETYNLQLLKIIKDFQSQWIEFLWFFYLFLFFSTFCLMFKNDRLFKYKYTNMQK